MKGGTTQWYSTSSKPNSFFARLLLELIKDILYGCSHFSSHPTAGAKPAVFFFISSPQAAIRLRLRFNPPSDTK
jgi:hypothetical protein